MNNTLVIGLTGSIGSGKSTVSRQFAERGCYIIDADVLARVAVEPGSKALSAIAARFGDDVISLDGTLNRAALANRVFVSETETAALNAIVHPEVIRLMKSELDAAKQRGEAVVVLDVPLLFQAGLESLCGRTVAVSASPEVRLQRICARDGFTPEQAKLRMNAQPADIYYTERATDVIRNDGDEAELRAAVAQLCERFGR